ncbi:phosphotransferase [Bacillus sp. DTU_2020_1000418_1_SI_GHA_SEK_038]|uniref:phosphotransferase enzyme family protein n=1 Tax=Bacillus sp. DTU_2020_1000418_1_SI_GHA_SEK_038 TaxID=3077585 RepID=UPI0028E9CEDB|nr:phosphotransferase [Bacillus sp. DTU_2020_1000418_1_SI_GHA_SEK_038]WNS76966.1 phosphotransferase [Bacillus sp. DTU_2020_1000418_1_SI_GHA_SEK_038]
MEKYVGVLRTKEIMIHFLKSFSLEDEYKLLGDFENFVYEVYKEGKPYILRITHSSHRELEDLYAEIEWVNYLSKQGLNVPTLFQSINGKFVEFIPANDESVFFGSLFSKASGEPVKMKDNSINKDLFSAWGKQIGKMHSATKNYMPSPLIKKRPHWYEDELLDIEKHFPTTETTAIQNAIDLLEQIKTLPIESDNYALIHTDIHAGNFFYDGNSIHVFDFDDCCYHWLVSDIAIPLYYSCLSSFTTDEVNEREEFGRLFIDAFLAGYETECNLPHGWEQQLPLFLMLRDVTLYSVFNKKIAPEDRNERIISLIDEIKSRIEQKKSIVNINFIASN